MTKVFFKTCLIHYQYKEKGQLLINFKDTKFSLKSVQSFSDCLKNRRNSRTLKIRKTNGYCHKSMQRECITNLNKSLSSEQFCFYQTETMFITWPIARDASTLKEQRIGTLEMKFYSLSIQKIIKFLRFPKAQR